MAVVLQALEVGAFVLCGALEGFDGMGAIVEGEVSEAAEVSTRRYQIKGLGDFQFLSSYGGLVVGEGESSVALGDDDLLDDGVFGVFAARAWLAVGRRRRCRYRGRR